MGAIIVWVIFLPALIMCVGGAIAGIFALIEKDSEYANSRNLGASILAIILFIIGAIVSFCILRAV